MGSFACHPIFSGPSLYYGENIVVCMYTAAIQTFLNQPKNARVIFNKCQNEMTWFAYENICRRSSSGSNHGANLGAPATELSAAAVCLEKKMHEQSLSSTQIDLYHRPAVTARTWASTSAEKKRCDIKNAFPCHGPPPLHALIASPNPSNPMGWRLGEKLRRPAVTPVSSARSLVVLVASLTIRNTGMSIVTRFALSLSYQPQYAIIFRHFLGLLFFTQHNRIVSFLETCRRC